MADAGVEREAQAVWHRGVGQRLVFGELGLVQGELRGRDDLRVGAEGELEQAAVAAGGGGGRFGGPARGASWGGPRGGGWVNSVGGSASHAPSASRPAGVSR